MYMHNPHLKFLESSRKYYTIIPGWQKEKYFLHLWLHANHDPLPSIMWLCEMGTVNIEIHENISRFLKEKVKTPFVGKRSKKFPKGLEVRMEEKMFNSN